MNILLHVCCANCAIYPVGVLRGQGHAVTGYFFNNNIHPYQEFARRLDTVREYAAKADLQMTYRQEYLLEEFLSQVAAQPDRRCHYCYRSRLEQTALYAAQNGFEAFSSSLLYSRYQDHDEIRSQGEQLAKEHGLTFVYDDFRQGWRQGIDISKEMGLYRQQYCGCIYSEKERYCPPENG